jgi:MoxR-like ATPase
VNISDTANALKLAALVQSIASQSQSLDEAAVARITRSTIDGLLAEERKALSSLTPHARAAAFEPSQTYTQTATCKRLGKAISVARRSGKRLVVVSGPSGSSKTFSARHAIHGQALPQYLVECSGATTVEDLVERPWTNSEGRLVWVEQAIVRAAREGAVVVLDEFDLADPSVVGRLHGIVDIGGTIRLASGEELKAHDDFLVIACCNGLRRDSGGNYSVQTISSALLGRAVFVAADYLTETDEVAIYVAHGYAREASKQVYTALTGLRRAFVAGKIPVPPSPRLGLTVLAGLQCGLDETEAWGLALLDGLDAKARAAAQQSIAAASATAAP